MIKNICTVFIILIGYTSACFSIIEQQNDLKKQHIIVLESPENKNHYLHYLLANFYHAQGDVKKSFDTYESLLKKNPSPHAYRGFFSLLFDIGQFKTITNIYEIYGDVERALKNNIESQLILAQAYLNQNEETKAEKIFVHLSRDYPDNEQIAYFSSISFLKSNQLEKALNSIDNAINNNALKQRHFLFYLLKSKILVQQNKLEDALILIEKSIERFPRFDKALLFKAVLLEQMGKINESITGYKQFLTVAGKNPSVEKQLAQLLFSQKRYSEALTYLKKIKAHSPEYFFDLGLIEYKTGNFDKALSYLNQSIKLDGSFEKARLLIFEILLQVQKIPDLLAFATDWILKNPTNPLALHSFMLLRNTTIKPKLLIKTLENIENKKTDILIFSALADLHLYTKNHSQAEKYYLKILNINQNDQIKSKILFYCGYIYFITKQHKKLESTLKKSLQSKIIHPSTYNLLAYHYAQNNKNLTEALELIEKALSSTPECPYYLDTKGYILFKMNKKKAASEIWHNAEKLSPTDQIIKNHIKLLKE